MDEKEKEKLLKKIEEYDEAIKLDSNNAPYYNGRGNAYYKLEDYEKAISDYSQAINLDSKEAIYYNNMGNAYKNLGNNEKAIESYEKAIELNPNDNSAKKLKKIILELKENKKNKNFKESFQQDDNKIVDISENSKILEKINEIEAEIFSSEFYKDGNLEKDKLNKQNKFLDSYGLEVIQIEDGFMLIEKNKFYYNLFKNFVTDDYKEFLKLRSEDIDYFEDSNSFDKYLEIIADKIVAWEKFLEKYPDSKLKRKAQNMSYTYRAGYIFRLTSSETRESLMNGKANDAVKEFNRFIKKYPNSPTSDIIKYYLENYKEEDIDTLISKKLNKNYEGE